MKDSYLYLNYEKDKKEADTEHEWKLFSERVGLSKKLYPQVNISH